MTQPLTNPRGVFAFSEQGSDERRGDGVGPGSAAAAAISLEDGAALIGRTGGVWTPPPPGISRKPSSYRLPLPLLL